MAGLCAALPRPAALRAALLLRHAALLSAAARPLSTGRRHLLSEATEGLEPAEVWRWFDELSAIPRPSGHEEEVAQYLVAWATERGLQHRQDGAGNVVIYRNGTGGGEAAPPVVMQAHMDMVPATAPGVQHDWNADPVQLVRAGPDWIGANGTTLGADDGIGMAAILACLDQPGEAALPPIQALFTTDEEAGLTGATGLDASLLGGAQWMLNLDSEVFPDVVIGSAGGGQTDLDLTVPQEAAPADAALLEANVSGLLGGHSGLNIDEHRANAAKLVAALAYTLLDAEPSARLARWAQLVQQYGAEEVGMALSVGWWPTPPGQRVLRPEGAARLVGLVRALPNGALKLDSSLPGQVESSTSLDILNATASNSREAGFKLMLLTRSSLDFSVADWRAAIADIGGRYGARVTQGDVMPGWPANLGSLIANMTAEAVAAVTGQPAPMVSVHAGLEVAQIVAKLPGLEAASIGPVIQDAHTPGERVSISSVQQFYAALLGTLRSLAEL